MFTVRHRFAIVALAALLPVIILASVLIVILANHERQDTEARVRDRMHRVVELIDREMTAQIKALAALATADALASDNLAAFYERASRVKALDPSWVTVTLADTDGNQLFSLLHPFGTVVGPVIDRASFETIARTQKPVVGGISPPGRAQSRRLIAVRVPVIRDGQLKYVLTAAIGPERIQSLLDAGDLTPTWLAAVVDQNGAIVARIPHIEALIGQLATEDARRFRAEASEGSYRAANLQGRRLVAVFGTSTLTGWSVHIGVPEEEFDRWLTRSIWLAGAGGVGSVALLGLLFVYVFREIARHRRAEAGLRQAQKMEALGQMTGGIAHDFNNLLMVIVGNVALVEASGALPKASKDQLAAALKAAQRGAALVRQLLAFARRQALLLQIVEPNRLIAEFELLLQRAAGKDITLSLDLALSPGACRLDIAQFEATMLNLAVNARDAMPDGGSITIETRSVEARERHTADSLGIAPGDYVLVRVADTGTGMPAEIVARAFEPFFTTKEVGKGSGLGLSMVYGFVQQSGGHAKIELTVGVGTAVSLYLPRIPAEAAIAAIEAAGGAGIEAAP